MAAHGYAKTTGPSGLAGTAGWFDSMGMRPGIVHARLAAGFEIVSGLLLAAGFLTAFAGAPQKNTSGLPRSGAAAILTVISFGGTEFSPSIISVAAGTERWCRAPARRPSCEKCGHPSRRPFLAILAALC